MIAPLKFIKISLLLLTSFILTACHSDSSNNSKTPDINTFNMYTYDQKIYSFNEDTGSSTKRGEFNVGENQFIELNTDEEKQGYEYAVYVFENSVYLLNYDKDSNAKRIELAELYSSQEVCGLIPHKTASEKSFADKGKSNRSTLDLPIITIEYKQENQVCDPELNTRDTLNFSTAIKENEDNLLDIFKTTGKSEDILGGHIIDYSSDNNSRLDQIFEDDDDIDYDYGASGFLGKKTAIANTEIIDTIVFSYKVDGIHDQWEKVLSPSAGVQKISQVSNDQVLVQEGKDIYILKTEKLFTLNTEENSTPIPDRINSLFLNPYLTLDDNTAITSNPTQNDDTFIIKQNNKIYFYQDEKFQVVPANEAPVVQNTTKIKADLTDNDIVLVLQESNNIQTLVAIPGKTGLSSTVLSADSIEFHIIGDEFYANSLNFGQNIGWQAHWFKKNNDNFVRKTYNDSRFLFTKNLQAKSSDLYLLSSDTPSIDNKIIDPSLYKYDRKQSNGRKKGKSKKSGTIAFSYGKLNTNVSDIINSTIINDIYGRITLKGINKDSGAGRSAEEYYYFNPSQSVTTQNINKQSLKLIKRTIL